MMLSTIRHVALITACLTCACSSSSSSPADAGAVTDSRADSSDSSTADGAAAPSCADYGGTCTASCASGATEVLDGSDTLCGGSGRCCVPTPMAGALTLHGDYGLACTSHHFTEFTAGTCGGASCAVGCECTATSGATCDCSRGAPPTQDGVVNCALFNCGVSTCAFGCHCADPQSGACVCP